MYKQITIKTLHKQGTNNSEIARQLSCHRNTVSNIISRPQVKELQTRVKPSVFAPYETQIKEYRDKKVTNLRIYELLKEMFDVKSTYINLCKYIQKYFPKPVAAFGVQQVTPGEVAEIDFGYLGLLPGTCGKLVKTYGLAVVLPYSRLGFWAITYDQKLETLCRELTQAFDYFGGVPKRLKVDNMRTAILKNQHYDLQFNQDFLEFANHYTAVIIPCTPYSPQQKGTVEGAIKYLQMNFVGGRSFVDDTDIKRQLRVWMDTYANTRIHGTTKKVPAAVFQAEEKSALQPLPQEEFAFFNRGSRQVGLNCHIHFENNYYSVPSALVGKEVTIRWNEHLVRVVFQGEQVALHHLAAGQGNYVTVRSHLPDYKIYSQTEYQARSEAQMTAIGEAAHEYFINLLTTKESYWFRNVRIILGLEKEYGAEAVNLSLKRALYYQASDISTIRNILKKQLYLLAVEPVLSKQSDQSGQSDQNGQNDDQSMSRSLSYYCLPEGGIAT